MTVQCQGENCNWRIHASVLPDDKTFMVKTLQPTHSCIRVDCTQNPYVNIEWVSQKINELLKFDPNMSYELMQGKIKK